MCYPTGKLRWELAATVMPAPSMGGQAVSFAVIRATTKRQQNNRSRKFVSNSVSPIFIHDPSSKQTPETPLFPSLTPYGSIVLREEIIPDPTCSFPACLAHSLLPAAVSLQTYPIATGLDPAITPIPAPGSFRSRSVKNTGWRTAGLYLFCVRGGETSGALGAAY